MFLSFPFLNLPKILANFKDMKKTLLIALLLIPFLGISQTKKPIDGFLGVKFGSSKADVVAALTAKGASLDKANTKEDFFVFRNVKLGPRETQYFTVSFTNDKAYFAVFIFKPEDRPKTVDYYNNLVRDISEIYGTGKPYVNFKSPYKYGDEDEIVALQGGYATMYTTWKSDKNIIEASIKHDDDELTVALIYQDGVLAAEQAAKQKAKEKSDY